MRLFLLAAAAAMAAEPRVRLFLTESGAVQISGREVAITGPTTPENIEVMKQFQKLCPAVAITGDRAKADYIVRVDREPPSPVTPFVKGNKVAIFNRDADLIYSNSSRTLAPLVKGSCAAVLPKK